MRKKISWLFLLTVFLTLFSCRNDLLPEQQAYDNSSKFQLKSKRISLNQSKHKTKLITELQQAETVLKKANTSVNGKLVAYYKFIIDTDQIVYIENGPNYHTYTFRIVTQNEQADAPVENLIFTPLTGWYLQEITGFLSSYSAGKTASSKRSADKHQRKSDRNGSGNRNVKYTYR